MKKNSFCYGLVLTYSLLSFVADAQTETEQKRVANITTTEQEIALCKKQLNTNNVNDKRIAQCVEENRKIEKIRGGAPP